MTQDGAENFLVQKCIRKCDSEESLETHLQVSEDIWSILVMESITLDDWVNTIKSLLLTHRMFDRIIASIGMHFISRKMTSSLREIRGRMLPFENNSSTLRSIVYLGNRNIRQLSIMEMTIMAKCRYEIQSEDSKGNTVKAVIGYPIVLLMARCNEICTQKEKYGVGERILAYFSPNVAKELVLASQGKYKCIVCENIFEGQRHQCENCSKNIKF